MFDPCTLEATRAPLLRRGTSRGTIGTSTHRMGDRMTTTATVSMLTGFPRQFADLPALQRAVLAVLMAANDEGRSVPWWEVLDSVARLSAEGKIDSPQAPFERAVSVAVANLEDYGLTRATFAGLEPTPQAIDTRESWNGPFKELVAFVREGTESAVVAG